MHITSNYIRILPLTIRSKLQEKKNQTVADSSRQEKWQEEIITSSRLKKSEKSNKLEFDVEVEVEVEVERNPATVPVEVTRTSPLLNIMHACFEPRLSNLEVRIVEYRDFQQIHHISHLTILQSHNFPNIHVIYRSQAPKKEKA